MNLAIFNPHDKPVGDLPAIYGWNNGGAPGFYHGVLLAEDGEGLGGHICSSEWFIPGDLGLLEGSRPDRHDLFRQHYPDGYRMVYVQPSEVQTHAGIDAAIELNAAKAQSARLRAEIAK